MIFLQPDTREKLIEALGGMTENSYLVAGCTDFLAKRNGVAWDADVLLSLTSLQELRRIEVREGELCIGTACTHTQVEESALVGKWVPALAQACGNVGSRQIRNRGTVGGSVGNASPAGDVFPVLLTLNSKVEILNSTGECRTVPVGEIICGMGKTSLAPDEVMTEFRIPLPREGAVCAFAKLGERAKVTIAKISVAIAADTESGRLKNVRVALGAVAAKSFLSAEAAAVLEGAECSALPEEAFAQTLSAVIRNSIPTRASMPYKAAAVRGLAKDVLALL